jgi:cell division transport system ATP-binding protein
VSSNSIINLQGVSVYQKNKLVLTNVKLVVNQGDFIYLIGKTGSGKSSLLKLIYADLPLETGVATVCGFDLKSIRRKEIPFLRRKLGIVFQDFQLLADRTVEENLMFVLRATGWKDKSEMMKRVLSVLDAVGLISKLKVLPHQLSGGEQQKAGIARALLNQPEVILADEPTGNLDPEASNDIVKLLLRISQSGKTVIMATHNYNLIHKFPGQVIKCEEGSIAPQGGL